MSDHVLEKAKLRLDALEQEAAELRTFIRMYTKLAGNSGGSDSEPRKRAASPDSNGHAQSASERYSTRDEIVSAAREVLRAHAPEALHINKLYDALVAKGIRISGRNPKGNLSAKLAPPADLVYVRDRGWVYRPSLINQSAGDYTSPADRSSSGASANLQED